MIWLYFSVSTKMIKLVSNRRVQQALWCSVCSIQSLLVTVENGLKESFLSRVAPLRSSELARDLSMGPVFLFPDLLEISSLCGASDDVKLPSHFALTNLKFNSEIWFYKNFSNFQINYRMNSNGFVELRHEV